ncbi:hypothetical protein ACLMJK_008562 [Lecanora helva]
MPKYYGRNTAIQLSVTDLQNVITQHPQNKQCPETTNSIVSIEGEFAKASEQRTLAEETLCGKDGHHLQFLGEHENLPFCMVYAGRGLFSCDVTRKRAQRSDKTLEQQTTVNTQVYDSNIDDVSEGDFHLPEAVDDSLQGKSCDALQADEMEALTANKNKPQDKSYALCLTVFLSRASFSHITYEKGLRKTVNTDLKIDLYFNGQFADSQIIQCRQFNSTGIRGMKARVLRFTGQRLSRMIEKPWIFVSEEVAKTSFLASQNATSTSRLRWTAVSNALRAEAAQFGRDKHGSCTVTGDYLESLASLEVPLDLRKDQAVAGFGVIDVVVTYGRGAKDSPDTPYITKPTRSRSERQHCNSHYERVEPLAQEGNQLDSRATLQPATTALNTVRPPALCMAGSQQPNEGNLSMDSNPETRTGVVLAPLVPSAPKSQSSKVMAKASPTPNTPTEALAAAETLVNISKRPLMADPRLIKSLFPPDRVRANNPKRPHQPSLPLTQSSEEPRKRHRGIHYHHVLTTKQTLSEELQSIAERAMDGVQETRRRTKPTSPHVPKTAVVVNSGSDQVQTPRKGKVVTLKISPEKLRTSPIKINLGSTTSPPTSPDEGPLASHTAGSHSTPTTGIPATTSSSSRRRSRKRPSQPVSNENQVFDASFTVPELSRNCCITYAEPGIVRNVGAVRGGWFVEEGVVMGTRFIVG